MGLNGTLQERALAGATAADFYVSTLPDLEPAHALSLSSGYLPARPPKAGSSSSSSDAADDAHLFFLLERARHTPKKRRLILWLNGGPGCSSFDGVLMEVGAFRPNDKGGLDWAPPGGAWNEYADVLYLDQPVGTGFSYVSTNGYTSSLQQAADEVMFFLKRFIEIYPEYRRGEGVDTYVAGESFAGQYIPYVANALREAGAASPVDLKGIAIGNGYIDPIAQYGSELDMMVEAKIWDTSSEEYKRNDKLKQQCRRALDSIKGDPPRWVDECEDLLSEIVGETTHRVGGRNTCINIYDVRLSDESPACGMNWPPLVGPMYKYLDRQDVRTALHVDKKHKPEAWVECNKRVGNRLTDRSSKASVVHLPKLLESGVQVLLFAGDQDLICNHIGVERVPERLQWGGSGWGNPSKVDWFVNNARAGYWRTNRNLTYVSISGGSHMVPYDKPVETHDMMLRFMGVDLLAAAGPSARIPSRLGDEKDRMVLIGGGGGTEKDDRPMIPGVDGKTEAEVAEEAKWAAYYNAGSAALIVLILLVGLGVCILLRLRRRSRKISFAQLPTSEGRRGGGGGGGGISASEENHELEHLVVDDGGVEDDRYSDETTTRLRKQAGNGIQSQDQDIFDVGDESDEEDGANPKANS